MDLVIKNGTIVTASDSYKADIGIMNGKIVALGQDLSGDENIMGSFKTKKVGNILGWLTFVLISLVGIGAIISIFI